MAGGRRRWRGRRAYSTDRCPPWSPPTAGGHEANHGRVKVEPPSTQACTGLDGAPTQVSVCAAMLPEEATGRNTQLGLSGDGCATLSFLI